MNWFENVKKVKTYLRLLKSEEGRKLIVKLYKLKKEI